MTADALRDRLKRILAQQLNSPSGLDSIREDTPLHGKGLGLDSVDVVSLIVKVEEEFEIFIEADEVADSVRTFGALLKTVHRKVHGEAPQ
jgi:acyl carrier protein